MRARGRSVAFVPAAVIALVLGAAPAVLAVCPPTDPPTSPAPPLRATLKFQSSPADVTFAPGAPISLVMQIDNCSGTNVLTTEGFSSSDFFRRLYFVDPNGQTIATTTEGGSVGSATLKPMLHGVGRHYFCQYRTGVAQNPAIPVVPVETLPGSPAPFFREYSIDNVLTLYPLSEPGHYSVTAHIPLLTADTGNPAAILNDCDFFDGNTVVNVGNPSQAFTLVSNTLEFVVAESTVAAAHSSIIGSGPIPANGSDTSTVTITLKTAGNAAVPGVTPTFLASGSDNTLGACSPTNGSGVSTCTLQSTMGEVKTLSIATPIVKAGGTVTFTANAAHHVGLAPDVATVAAGSYAVFSVESFDAFNHGLGDVTATSTFRVKGGKCVGRSCTATALGPHVVTAANAMKTDTATLNVVAPLDLVRVWVGLSDKAHTGIKFDLQAILKKDGVPVGSGLLASVAGGAINFTGAKLKKIPLLALAGPVDLSSGTLSLEVLVRNACAKSTKDAGTARLWFNGAKDDAGGNRDAASRIDPPAGTGTLFFLREGNALEPDAGAARAFVDVPLGAKCGAFQPFGVWTRTLP